MMMALKRSNEHFHNERCQLQSAMLTVVGNRKASCLTEKVWEKER
jgi:hypothetical protein